jgi:hypothetical protein
MSDSATHHVFTEADEPLHPASDNPLWQESVLLHWFDREQGVGGWHRVGREPNNQGGRGALWSYIFHGPDGWQYRNNGDVVLASADHFSTGFGSGPALRFSYENGAAHWFVSEGDVEAHLICKNLFPIVDPFPKTDALAAARYARHFEVAGTVTGHVSYRGKRTEVRGFGYRDHSWGPRDWDNGMPNHRWFTGTLDGAISFAAITAQAPSGNISRVGYVHRRGAVVLASDVDVVAHMEPDGLTHRGGELTITLPGDEKFQVRFKSRAGVAFQRGSVVMVEMICEAEGHGMRGYCDAEISTNPRRGVGPILNLINATATNGVTPFRLLSFAL